MTFYALCISGSSSHLTTSAASRAEALMQFSEQLGYFLTEDPTGLMSDLTLDEWTENPHYIRATIPVFRKP